MAQGSRKRGRIFIYIALILILGLVLVWALLKNPAGLTTPGSPAAVPTTDLVDIVVTTQQVARGTEFSEAVLTTIPYPRSNDIPGTFFHSISEVVGKRAGMDITQGVPLTTSMVAETAVGSSAAFKVPKGMVAISIPISQLTSVSYAPQAGDSVNIISTMLFVDLDTNYQTVLPNHIEALTAPGTDTGQALKPVTVSGQYDRGAPAPVGRIEMDGAINQPVYVVPSENQRPRMVSQTLLQDVLVLQVGDFPEETTPVAAVATPQPTAVPANQGDQGTQAQVQPAAPPAMMTLVVTPQDALTLNYMIYSGARLTLALRSAGDNQRVQTEAVTQQYLMDQYNIPLPAKLPYTTDPRIDVLPSYGVDTGSNVTPQ
ncbi:MAG: RcpC/CpaB family pilus assembly protein [Chloroflexi bacterium]|nr:RcpC/CpaB family pilus assembly protein [Chloroflexota bacterium]